MSHLSDGWTGWRSDVTPPSSLRRAVTVLLGDLNSAADGIGAVPWQSDTPPYATMLAAFADAAVGTGKKPRQQHQKERA